jgi:hypothetical protein
MNIYKDMDIVSDGSDIDSMRYVYTYIYKYLCVRLYEYACLYMCKYMYIYICIYTYVNIHIIGKKATTHYYIHTYN